MDGKINGWIYYRNLTGDMVAYYPNVEQIVFTTDEGFERWLSAESNA